MQRRFFIMASVAATAVAAMPAEAAEWVRLGERQVNLLADFDTIPVGIKDGLFTNIRLEVRGNTILIGNLRIVFADGSRADLDVRSKIRAGTRTRSIPLPGVVRAIRRIELSYARGLQPGKVAVIVWGRRV